MMDDLAWLLLLANTCSAVFVFLRELVRRGGYVTLPFLTALMFLSWYLPQAWKLSSSAALAPESLARLFFMSLLCFWAMDMGWSSGLGKRWRRPEPLDLPVRDLLFPVYAITFFALAMHALINMQPAAVRAMGQWTGPITIIYFFSTVGVISMVLSTAMIMKRFQFLTLLLFALNLAIYLPRIVVFFRRAEMFEFALAILLGILFVSRRTVPRVTILVAAVVGLFVMNGIGELRSLGGGYRLTDAGTIETRLPSVDEIVSVNWFDALNHSGSIERSEVMNAAVGMEAVALYGSFTLGAQYWNAIVHAYVPGQIVGHGLKRDLMIGINAITLAQLALDFDRQTGTTSTGFPAPYQDFWFFGCVVWWLTGYVMGRFMQSALTGSVIGYVLYASTITNAVHVTTHFGYYLFSQSVLILITVLWVQYWLKRTSAKRGQHFIRGPVS